LCQATLIGKKFNCQGYRVVVNYGNAAKRIFESQSVDPSVQKSGQGGSRGLDGGSGSAIGDFGVSLVK